MRWGEMWRLWKTIERAREVEAVIRSAGGDPFLAVNVYYPDALLCLVGAPAEEMWWATAVWDAGGFSFQVSEALIPLTREAAELLGRSFQRQPFADPQVRMAVVPC